MEEVAMETFLGSCSAFFSECMTWMSDVLNMVTASPALIIMILAMPICGFGISLIGRLFRM